MRVEVYIMTPDGIVFEFPNGRVNPGEAIEKAASRIAFETIGLKLARSKASYKRLPCVNVKGENQEMLVYVKSYVVKSRLKVKTLGDCTKIIESHDDDDGMRLARLYALEYMEIV